MTTRFTEINPDLKFADMNEYQRSSLTRIAHRHNEISRIFKKMKELLGIESEEGQDPGKGDEPAPKGEKK
jgi:hypothetical protein